MIPLKKRNAGRCSSFFYSEAIVNGKRALTGLILVLIIIAAGSALMGCETHAQAKAIMARGKCLDCHTIGGKGGSVGPNLTNVGGRRTRDFIVQQIKSPQSHNPNTAMPSFAGRMTDQEINLVADYLAGMK